MAEQRCYTVTELNGYMRQAVRKAAFLRALRVSGEVSNLSVQQNSGHAYFTLKDATAQVRCVFFGFKRHPELARIHNGMAVEVWGEADFYSPSGQFQLVLKGIEAAGLGKLYEAYERLKNKLEAEGLFAAEHKRPIPLLPRRIGVITSPTGAVIRDIIHVLSRRFPNFDLLLAPVRVQGEGAAEMMIQALRQLEAIPEIDVIIIGRGGGSLEDLWEFNDEALARALYACSKPLISAVGHETDFSICDYVCDLRAPTPSAAAECAVPVKSGYSDFIQEQSQRLSQAWLRGQELRRSQLRQLRQSAYLQDPGRITEQARLRLKHCLESPSLRAPERLWLEQRQRLDMAREALIQGLGSQVLWGQERLQRSLYRLEQLGQEAQRRRSIQLTSLEARLQAMDPHRVLARGYALLTAEREGRVLASVEGLEAGMALQAQLADGLLHCRVEGVEARPAVAASDRGQEPAGTLSKSTD